MRTLILLVAGVMLAPFLNAKEKPAFVIYTAKGGNADFEKIMKLAEEKQYIFFGEYHNNPISHWLQFEVTRELHAMKKNNLVLGAEMFEADNQYIMDEYLSGLISEKSFMEEG